MQVHTVYKPKYCFPGMKNSKKFPHEILSSQLQLNPASWTNNSQEISAFPRRGETYDSHALTHSRVCTPSAIETHPIAKPTVQKAKIHR